MSLHRQQRENYSGPHGMEKNTMHPSAGERRSTWYMSNAARITKVVLSRSEERSGRARPVRRRQTVTPSSSIQPRFAP